MSENMFLALEMLAQGMIGIFVVLGIIALLVLLMGKTGGKKKGWACFPIETLRGVWNLLVPDPAFLSREDGSPQAADCWGRKFPSGPAGQNRPQNSLRGAAAGSVSLRGGGQKRGGELTGSSPPL